MNDPDTSSTSFGQTPTGRRNIHIDRLAIRVHGLPAREARAALEGLGEQVLRQLQGSSGLALRHPVEGLALRHPHEGRLEIKTLQPPALRFSRTATPPQVRQALAAAVAREIISAGKPEPGES